MNEEAHEKLLARWYGRLDPNHSLDVDGSEEDRAWYVDLDAWRGTGSDPEALRGPTVVDDILDAVRLASHQPQPGSTHLFAGFRGTGKTTELGRLAHKLRRCSPGFSVLRVRARDYHGLADAISMEEMAVLLAAGIGEAALHTLGDNALPRLRKSGIWERLHGRLRQVLGDEAITFKLGVADLKPALFKGTSLRDQLREALGERAEDKLREFLHGFVQEIAAAIAPRQLVVLVDDLDKYTVSAPNVAKVYQQMADLFFHNGPLLKLPNCHTIYTIPPYLAFLNQEIAGVFDGLLHVLPAVKVQGRPPEREKHGPGIAALTELVAQRVNLEQLFGATRDACMRRLVIASGGNLRDLGSLMKMVVQAALSRRLPVGMREVDDVLTRQAAVRTLWKDDVDILLEVSKFGELRPVERARLGAFAGAMDQHLMLCYCNGDFWYDAHPLIAHKLQRAREISSPGEPK